MVVHMGIVALILESQSAFREEGFPEVMRDPMLHTFFRGQILMPRRSFQESGTNGTVVMLHGGQPGL